MIQTKRETIIRDSAMQIGPMQTWLAKQTAMEQRNWPQINQENNCLPWRDLLQQIDC